jgi:hypothetical protein
MRLRIGSIEGESSTDSRSLDGGSCVLHSHESIPFAAPQLRPPFRSPLASVAVASALFSDRSGIALALRSEGSTARRELVTDPLHD